MGKKADKGTRPVTSEGPGEAADLPEEPRWTPENRPVVDGSKPASGAAPQARVFYSGSA